MSANTFNRVEKKFILNQEQYLNIKRDLESKYNQDVLISGHEEYNISNIYYDTYENLIIKKSISKPVSKQKLRLRAYGTVTSGSMIFLELKRKINGYVNKRRTLISLDDLHELIDHNQLPEIKEYHNLQVLKEILYFIKQYDLKPSLYLYYERETYTTNDKGGLRITFDKNITTRRYDLDITKGIFGQHLLDDDLYVLEIKTNSNIPLWLNDLLNKNHVY